MGRAYLELSVDHCALSEPAHVDAPEQRTIAKKLKVSLGILRVCTFHFWRCHGLHVILFDDSHGIFFYWYAILFYILVTETLSSKVTAERLKLAGVKEMWDVGRAYLLCLSPIGKVLSIVAVHTSNSSRALSESASCHVDASERTISEEMVQTNVTLGVLM